MAINNSLMVTTTTLNQYFVDKSTGAPLANGEVWFYEDKQRLVPKLVYQKNNTGAVDAQGNVIYTFDAMQNPLNLSGVGTFVDNNGNQVAVYLYPFDVNTGALQLYYIKCFDSLGNLQFVREGWPDTFATENLDYADGLSDNLISNSQFVRILFSETNGLAATIAANTTNQTIQIAPDWTMNVSTSSAGTGQVSIIRVPFAGTSQIPTRTPYVLSVTPSGSITNLTITQTLQNNPGIWCLDALNNGGNVGVSILLANGTEMTINYIEMPSGLTVPLLPTITNNTGFYEVFPNVVSLPNSTNNSLAPTGYTNIQLQLPVDQPSLFSSVQVIYLGNSSVEPQYIQESVNRQIDHLFNYYEPILSYKPTPSYLTGWNFQLNPHQFLGPTISPKSAISYYAWDQTIIYQSAASMVNVTQSAIGGFRLTAAGNVQIAIIQYIPAVGFGIFQAINMLTNPISAMVSCYSSAAITASIGIWYTNGTLPSTVGSGVSMVSSLDANGNVLTTSPNWYAVPRNNLSNATFTSNTSALFPYVQHGFNGWQFPITSPPISLSTVEYVAVVIGTSMLTNTQWIEFGDISVCPGNNPTSTPAQSAGQVLNNCSYYYASSFLSGIVPATQTTLANGYVNVSPTMGGGTPPIRANFTFPVKMYKTPTTIITYNPINNNAQVTSANTMAPGDATSTNVNCNSNNSFFLTAVAAADQPCAFNYTADARLGQ